MAFPGIAAAFTGSVRHPVRASVRDEKPLCCNAIAIVNRITVNPLARPGTSAGVTYVALQAAGDIFFRVCRDFAARFPLDRGPVTTAVGSVAHTPRLRRAPPLRLLQFGRAGRRAPSRPPRRPVEFRAARLADRERTAKAVLAGDPAGDRGFAHQGRQRVGRGGAAILAAPSRGRRSCRAAAARRPAAGRRGRPAAAFLRRPRQPAPAGRVSSSAGGTGAASRCGSMASDTPAAAIRPAPSSTTSPSLQGGGNRSERSVAAG